VEVAVLGPVEVRIDGSPADLGSPKQRALVAALAMTPGRAVAVDTLVDLLWGDTPPASVSSTLQGYISHLRRALEPGRTRRSTPTVLVTVAPGYALAVPDSVVDAHAFESTVARAHAPLRDFPGWGPAPVPAAELERIVADLEGALGRWRGTPYGDLGDAPSVVPERTRLEELRLVALEDRLTAELALGRHTAAAVELEVLTGRHPLRERLWALRAVALQRSGRQADALAALRDLRGVLDEELGLEPSPAIRDLETALLRQDPHLAWLPPAGEAVPAASSPTPPAADPERAPEPAAPVAPWPLVGREAELAALTEALEAARRGTATFAVVTGEPGIGKTRLVEEVAAAAAGSGVRVLRGRCSQDDGAPPLWPWRAVLEGLGVELPAPGPTDDVGASFRSWEAVVREVERAAREKPTVVVLDDLHWADPSSLRVLGLLAEVVGSGSLLVVCTWRPLEVSPGLADVAEALARRHAVRLELDGLTADEAGAVFAGVSHREVSPEQGRRLQERTGGNPFFLVEYARLAGERADVDELTAEPPVAVTDVVRRRLARLDDKTVEALRVAAVVGRRFDTGTVAAVLGTDPDLLLDLVEPAQAAGLVEEEEIDRFVFVHALVRDSLLLGTSASRRARMHARVAAALEGTGRDSEVARHWLAAGPVHAGRAWRAAARAAEDARGLHAHEEAADLLVAALDALAADPEATAADRYDLLLQLVEAYRWAALVPELVRTVEQAIDAAEELGDLERAARAALSATEGGLWQSAPTGMNERVVATLRAGLEALPEEDGELRCRVMLALANELANVVPLPENRVLIDDALAMADRIGEPRLRLHARQVATSAVWTAATAEERLVWATEAVTLARDSGAEQAFVVSSTLRTVVLSELGRPDEMATAAAVSHAEAERLRIPYGELVLGAVTMPWLALRGRFEEGEELLGRMQVWAGHIHESFGGEALAAAQATLWMWQGEELRAAETLAGVAEETAYPLAPLVAALLLRAGEADRAREHLERTGGLALAPEHGELSAYLDCHAAEVALHLGDAATAAEVYRRLTPYAGRTGQAGSALNAGPVDSFLAMAAAATGEKVQAGRHADDALALMDEWGLSVGRAWFEGVRADFGF